MRSWYTTVAGISAFMVVLAQNIIALTDGNPETMVNIGALLAFFGVAGMGVAARDNNKSSEDVGAKHR